MSYVFRPRSRSKGWPICLPIAWPTASSKRGIDHPPYLKPPLESSSGPPGACITPSSVTNVRTISFLMLYVSLLVRNLCQSRLRGRGNSSVRVDRADPPGVSGEPSGGGLFLGLGLAPKPNLAQEERSYQRQDQYGSGIEEHVVQGPSEPGPERMKDLVEDGGCLRSSGRRRGSAPGRDSAGIEDCLRVAHAAGNKPIRLRRQVEAGDLRLNARRQSRGQHRAEHRRANRAPDLPPELNLAGRNTKELPGQRILNRLQVQREGSP